MELEQRVEELKNRIDLMKRLYYKGFGNIVCGIFFNSDSYLTEPAEEYRNLILEELSMVEGHYATIPFSELDSNEDFAPLFVVRDLLPWYGKVVRKFLEEPTKEMIKEIGHRRTTICEVGEVYRENFNQRLDELRQIPGYENFRVILIDYKGHKFCM
jgi:hypothetical protein